MLCEVTKYALRSQNAIFDSKSMLCEIKMQYLIQKVCFAKKHTPPVQNLSFSGHCFSDENIINVSLSRQIYVVNYEV